MEEIKNEEDMPEAEFQEAVEALTNFLAGEAEGLGKSGIDFDRISKLTEADLPEYFEGVGATIGCPCLKDECEAAPPIEVQRLRLAMYSLEVARVLGYDTEDDYDQFVDFLANGISTDPGLAESFVQMTIYMVQRGLQFERAYIDLRNPPE